MDQRRGGQDNPAVRHHVDRHGRTFWESASLDELAREQGVAPIRDIRELAGGFWLDDEWPDEFVSWLREQRRGDPS